MEQEEKRDALSVGVRWGAAGGVVGFVVCLLGSLVGVLAAGVVGLMCGRRAAAADAGSGVERSGGLSGLIGGAVAAPVFVLGASVGAVVSARWIGSAEIAGMLSDMLGTDVSSQEAWQLFLASLVFAAFLQLAVLVGASVAAGAWAGRKK